MSFHESDDTIPSLVNLLSFLTEMKSSEQNHVVPAVVDYVVEPLETKEGDTFYDSPLIMNSDPMLNSANCDNLKQLDEWKNKPVDRWTKRDVLFWVSDASEKADLNILNADMPNLCTLTGMDLISMTLEDFLNKMTNESFARRLYNALQNILNPNNHNNIENDVLTTLKACPLNDSVNYNDEFLQYKYPGCEDMNSLSTHSNDSTLRFDNDSGVESASESEQCMEGLQQDFNNDVWNDYDVFFNDNVAKNNKSSSEVSNVAVGNSSSYDNTNHDWQNWQSQSDYSNDQYSHSLPSVIENNELSNNECENSQSYLSSSDSESNHEQPEVPIKKRPGRPRGIRKKKPEKMGLCWEFLRDLLHNPKYNPSIICWDDYTIGKFKFVHSEKVAQMWGSKRENSLMTFDKFSRALRYHYKNNTLIAVQKRLVYQFGENAIGWRTTNPIIV